MAKKGGFIEVEGVTKLQSKLATVGQLKAAKTIIENNTAEMTNKAQRYAPVDTGNLQRKITMRTEDGRLTGKTTSRARYAGYQEYGTRFQISQPHLGPAYNQQKEQFKKDMTRLVK